MKSVPQIRHIHDLHVWRLEGKKIMGTIHIVFEGINDEKHFTKISKKIMVIAAMYRRIDVYCMLLVSRLSRIVETHEYVRDALSQAHTLTNTRSYWAYWRIIWRSNT